MKHLLLRDYLGQNITGWLMSEKLDGWRAFWSGEDFITREGNTLDAPEWFKAGMPSVMLDGEIFAGRGEFNSIQKRMRDGWHGLTFHAFDVPEYVAPFRKRLDYLTTLELPAHCRIVPHIRCRDTAHLMAFADEIVAAGGEGAVVRNPREKYAAGRSYDALRWVPQNPDVNRLKSA